MYCDAALEYEPRSAGKQRGGRGGEGSPDSTAHTQRERAPAPLRQPGPLNTPAINGLLHSRAVGTETHIERCATHKKMDEYGWIAFQELVWLDG